MYAITDMYHLIRGGVSIKLLLMSLVTVVTERGSEVTVKWNRSERWVEKTEQPLRMRDFTEWRHPSSLADRRYATGMDDVRWLANTSSMLG